MTDFDYYNVNKKELNAHAHELMNVRLTKDEKAEALKTILSCIDLTSLEGTDTNAKILSICDQAHSFAQKEKGISNVASVCFYPVFAKSASQQLTGTGINVAVVAGGFPSGQMTQALKEAEVRYAVDQGADEIDVVISRGLLLSGKCREFYEQIAGMRKAANGKKMKVILETGELDTVYRIRKACELALNGGADFLKTSTGKTKPGATPEAVIIMLNTIQEYYNKTGKMIGIKPSGGISEPDDAIGYYLLVKGILGEKWLTKETFRIGASRLALKIANTLN